MKGIPKSWGYPIQVMDDHERSIETTIFRTTQICFVAAKGLVLKNTDEFAMFWELPSSLQSLLWEEKTSHTWGARQTH